MLRDAGFVVDLAVNGAVALRKVQEARYDLVLMDLQMPVMDGLAATRAIRKLPDMAQLPIVAMTADAMMEDRAICLEAGMNDHVAKPVEPDALWTALLKWVPPRQAPVPMPAAVQPVMPADTSDVLAGIEGLDVATGLRRAMGKKPLYQGLLRLFVTGQRNAATEIKAALDHVDLVTAERIAHTLKGTAGTIGATSLQAAAARLEQALRERQLPALLDPLVTALALPLDALVAALESVLPVVKAPVSIASEIDRLAAGHA
jgi:CheY-like chemotaxis protein